MVGSLSDFAIGVLAMIERPFKMYRKGNWQHRKSISDQMNNLSEMNYATQAEGVEENGNLLN